jgi:inorganic pyrophosphatase
LLVTACLATGAGCRIEDRTNEVSVQIAGADSVGSPSLRAPGDGWFRTDTTVDLLRAPSPLDSVGNITIVVEIPAGTNDKWELNKTTGRLEWEQRDERPRVVVFLPYPGNYGFIPRTLLSREAGGDGDPLDVILLGPALPRGTVVSARLLGVLHMKDGGEHDDKLIATGLDGPFARITTLAEFRASYPDALDIVARWFGAYKGPGVMQVGDFADQREARRILDGAIAAFPAP